MTDKPSETAIREACRRAGCSYDYTFRAVNSLGGYNTAMLAASLIEKYEPDTLTDPYLKRARDILAEEVERNGYHIAAKNFRKGDYDYSYETRAVIRALKEGMPK